MATKDHPISDKELAGIRRACQLDAYEPDKKACVADGVKRAKGTHHDQALDDLCDLDPSVQKSAGIKPGMCKPKGRQH